MVYSNMLLLLAQKNKSGSYYQGAIGVIDVKGFLIKKKIELKVYEDEC